MGFICSIHEMCTHDISELHCYIIRSNGYILSLICQCAVKHDQEHVQDFIAKYMQCFMSVLGYQVSVHTYNI